MTTKVWAVRDDEADACISDPARIDALFHAADPAALIHGWRASLPASARAIAGAPDATWVVGAADLARILTARQHGRATAWDDVFAIATEAADGIEILDVARAAVAAGRGLMFCTFEDW